MAGTAIHDLPYFWNPMTPQRTPNFDTIRLLAALAVVISHSQPLAEGPAGTGLLWNVSHHQTTLVYSGLQVFFIISGYLVTGSYIANPDPARFIRARALRILPALIAVLWLLAFLIGPLLTTLPLTTYFTSALPYRAAFGLSGHLPGVFAHNPFSASIDGSLVSLRYEILCYAGILVLGLAGGINRPVISLLYVADLIARFHHGANPLYDLSALFLAGAAIRVWQPEFSPTFAAPAAILWGISLFFSGYPLISDTFGAYVVIFLGAAEFRLPNLAKFGDLSYGVFITAWPLQQIYDLIAGTHPNWIISNLFTIPLALILAWLSWHFIESRALALRQPNETEVAVAP
jgi:peptidoglycan/LPS O-acetylase OafA/YrhL